MQYVGIDYHKRYSVLCATDEPGQELKRPGSTATRLLVSLNFSPS